MSDSYRSTTPLPDFHLWQNEKRVPFSFELEVTARCNNDCRHCYINLPAGDTSVQRAELTLAEIDSLAGQAVKMGALWCLLTGGEPLLRKDFPEVYLLLKRKGLLVTVFTNACLITAEHVQLFKKYPPRAVEVTVYGASEETYERVSRKKGSYAAFRRGLALLLEAGIPVTLKAMAIRSNAAELAEIAAFCRQYSHEPFRFDPLLHLRYDRDPLRNQEIRAERLDAAEIVRIEQADDERTQQLVDSCQRLIHFEFAGHPCNHLFHCGAGKDSFTIGWDGTFRLCASLHHPDTLYDLRAGTLAEAWNEFVPRVLDLRCDDPAFLNGCRSCPLINLCLWCPAHGHLESGHMEQTGDYFCQVAHLRAAAIEQARQERQA